MTEKNEKWFRYVPYHREKAFEAAGWIYSSPLPAPHCVYASLYEWPGPGDPIEPPPPEEKIDNKNREG